MSNSYGPPGGDPRFGTGFGDARYTGRRGSGYSGQWSRSEGGRPPEDARWYPPGAPKRQQRPPRKPATRGWGLATELVVVVVVAAMLAWTMKTFLIQPFNIPSGSMLNTLQLGDRIMVSKLSPQWRPIHRGDIIVFHDPGNWLNEQPTKQGFAPLGWVRDGFELVGLAPASKDDDLVKRLIGIPGDTVKCCDANGRVTVNGVALDERDYLYPGDAPSLEPFEAFIPPGYLWVMGDHRSGSYDSRENQKNAPDFGLVPVDNVVGKVVVVAFPLRNAHRIQRPATFDQPALQPDTVSK